MYIFKNAYLSIVRGKGRNILIGIIITIITTGVLIALTINKSGEDLIDSYIDNNKLAVNFQLDTMQLRGAGDGAIANFETLTVDKVKEYGNSNYIDDYYYILESTMSSDDIEPIDNSVINPNEGNSSFGGNRVGGSNAIAMVRIGDFRLTAYSNFTYMSDFVNGNKKIVSGSMIEADDISKSIVISEELANANEIAVGDEVRFYIPSDDSKTFTFTVVGIYEEVIKEESNVGFMGLSAMTTSNNIYTNITSIGEITAATETGDTTTTQGQGIRIMASNGLTAKFYLKNQSDLELYEKELREKGLSEYYQLITNEDEILESLKPIQNLSDYSFTFLIVILIIGAIILGVINMINIRERKYEIGVLRAIGMKKKIVSAQLVTEIIMVAFISLTIGTTIGIALSQPVTNSLLANEIESYKNEANQMEENFGSPNFRTSPNGGNRMGGNNIMQRIINNPDVNYVESLVLSIDILTIGKVILTSLLLVSISGLISVMSINKYDPNKILQNRG